MQCSICSYEMTALDKECLRCKAEADKSTRNPYVAFQNAHRPMPEQSPGAVPFDEGIRQDSPRPHAPPPVATPAPVASAIHAAPSLVQQMLMSLVMALLAAVLAVFLYNQFVVRPRIQALNVRIAHLAINADHNALILDKHTKAIHDLADATDSLRGTVDQNAAATNSLQDTVNYNANADNMNRSGY